MKKMVIGILFSIISSLGLNTDLLAQPQPFSKEQRIRILVGFAPGGAMDLWARLVARHMGKHIPGSPSVIVQNMPGAGSMVAANYVYSVAKPDGLTLGLIFPSIYFEQLLGRKGVKFDFPKFSWIGSPEQPQQLFFIRSDLQYKTLVDLRKAKEPLACGTHGGPGASLYYVPRFLEEAFGVKFNMVSGYGGASEIDAAIERGELHCRAGSVLGLLATEPGRSWLKTGFVRVLVQSGSSRDPRIEEVPTIDELMEKHKTPQPTRQLGKVLLSGSDIGRPIVGPPGIPLDRVRVLREAFMKTLSDPELIALAKKSQLDVTPVTGEELTSLAREVINQPPSVIERLRSLLGA